MIDPDGAFGLPGSAPRGAGWIMNREDDFQTALNDRVDDWQTRLVFADWLQERGDPRAEGYRALGMLRLYPDTEYSLRFVYQSTGAWTPTGNVDRSVLPPDWYEPLQPEGALALEENESRWSAEDKVALAFALLTDQRRSELLAPPVP
jgi:uncharacterized protein (TIGR02996 family)